MKNSKKVKISIPYLALESKPNSFTPINLFDLDLMAKLNESGINIHDITNLMELDFVLGHFTKQEIVTSINNSNIIPFDFDDTVPMIILSGNHKLPLLTKEDNQKLGISELLDLVLVDSGLMNIYKNKFDWLFKKYYENHLSSDGINQMLIGFHNALTNKSKKLLENQFNAVFYYFRREMIIYMNEMIEKNHNRGIPLERKKESGEA